jgi:hypothetical protein
MIILLNKLPIPNLKHYCAFSLALFVVVLVYAQKILRDISKNEYTSEKYDKEYIKANGSFYTTYKVIVNEPWCIWVLINFCYCGLLIFSKIIQGLIFGKLRVVENQVMQCFIYNVFSFKL